MGSEDLEREERKRAIFDGMSKRGQERILKIGYDEWDPFQEPKDPRERIFSSTSLKANALLRDFYIGQGIEEESAVTHKEMFDFCRGLLQGERRALVLYEFCHWLKQKGFQNSPDPL
ncbi:MAG: hypothetical protein GX422_00500 [Deltaproteobacteria bacterium]|jgi:hypothetical protein|nr:hypothetical protein [Deltaproteobacteria bacterium]